MFLLSSKIPKFIPMYAKIHQLENKNHTRRFFKEGSRNDVSFRGYQAKGDERRQGEGGGS